MGRMCPPQSVKMWPTPACLSVRATRCPPFSSATGLLRAPTAADMRRDFRLLPDNAVRFYRHASINNLILAGKQGRGDRESQCPRRLEIDHEVELGGLLYGKLGGLRAIQELAREHTCAIPHVRKIRPIGQKTSGLCPYVIDADCWKSASAREVENLHP